MIRLHGLAVAAVFALAACGGDTPPTSTPKTGSTADVPADVPDGARLVLVMRNVAEPAGANCARGGYAVQAGLDANASGALDDAEVERTSYVCDAVPPAPQPVLTRRAAEAPGANCPNGGTRVDAGRDRDGDGALSAGEVEQSSFVCTPDAAPPKPVLVRSDPLPWNDSSCSAGAVVSDGQAVRVSSGVDEDGSGTLDPAEVTASLVLCSESVYVRYPVRTQEDLDLVTRSSRVAGSLSIQGSVLTDVVFYVAAVDGDIRVEDNPQLTRLLVDFGTLGGGILVRGNPVLDTLWAAPLWRERAWRLHGDLVVRDNPALQYFFATLDALTAIDGDFVVAANGKLAFFPEAPLLGRVDGDVRIEANPELTYCYGSSYWNSSFGYFLAIGGDLVVAGNPLLQGPLALEVATVDGKVTLDRNPAVSVVSFPSLVRAGGISVTNDGGSVRFDRLEVVTGDVTFSDNPTSAMLSGYATQQVPVVLGSITVARNGNGLGPLELLHDLAYVGGALRVEDNAAVWSLEMTPLVAAGDVVIARNPRLRTIGVDADQPLYDGLGALARARRLDVEDNPALRTLALPDLARASELTVTGNALLPTCQATRLGAQLQASPAPLVTIAGNDDAASCP